MAMPEPWPIFVESIHHFLPREHYNPGHRDYRLVINQQSALDGTDVRGASIETKLALKLCENGLPAEKIIDVSAAPAFAAKLPGFYFIDVPDRPTANPFLANMADAGWTSEVVKASLPNRVAGAAIVWKFTRPAAH